jgi:hypothetical protein
MAAIGATEAQKILNAATNVGITEDDLLATIRRPLLAYASNSDARTCWQMIRAAEEQQRQNAGLATDRQVAYITELLARRARDGEGGGFVGVSHLYAPNGTIDVDAVRALTKDAASQVITSLTGRY